MMFYNSLDERNRFIGLRAYHEDTSGQVDSHGFSYMHQRKMYEEIEEMKTGRKQPIGLEAEVTEE